MTRSNTQIVRFDDRNIDASEIDVLVLAAGFEERAFAYLERANFAEGAICLLVGYDNSIPENAKVYSQFFETAKSKFGPENVYTEFLKFNEFSEFFAAVREWVLTVPKHGARFCMDVSGFTSYAIFAALEAIRAAKPYDQLELIYSSAVEYVPSRAEYDALVEAKSPMETLPRSMAKEMAKNETFSPFAGHRSNDAKSCLFLFAGYEPHRSSGIIFETNPSLLLLIYGKPADEQLEWRLELSKLLHENYQKNRECAVEVVPTHDLDANIELLESYYEYLVDDHDVILSPVCSKIQVIASYLFWERYQEVQVVFPLPIGYEPSNGPKGVGDIFSFSVPGRINLVNESVPSESRPA